MKVLVTGSAGFIGSHLVLALLEKGFHVCGIDNVNDYYDVSLKQARLERLKPHSKFNFHKVDIRDGDAVAGLFDLHKPDRVIHLAAQAGVRYSIVDPHSYINANVIGFLNILESCRLVKSFLYFRMNKL